jgi:hypothetical protein
MRLSQKVGNLIPGATDGRPKTVKNDVGFFFAARFLGFYQGLHMAVCDTLRCTAS